MGRCLEAAPAGRGGRILRKLRSGHSGGDLWVLFGAVFLEDPSVDATVGRTAVCDPYHRIRALPLSSALDSDLGHLFGGGD